MSEIRGKNQVLSQSLIPFQLCPTAYPSVTASASPAAALPSDHPVAPDSAHRESIASFRQWVDTQLAAHSQNETGSEQDLSEQHLTERLQELGTAVHTRPREQPLAVSEITQRLFSGYQVDGGKTHLGGCQLTDFPFLRLTFAAADDPNQVVHVFIAHDGSSVPDTLAIDLGLLNLEPADKPFPRIDETALHALVAAGRRVVAKGASSRDPQAVSSEPLATAIVWVKQANGKLHFTIADSTATLPFSGWAKLIKPKPFVAEHSGASTFHLAATDDGRIDAFEQIAPCAVTGERVLIDELVTCSVTGKRVKKVLTEPCPVSGRPTLTDEFSTCPVCQQQVSKSVISQDACAACRGLHKIKKDDPRLVWIMGEHAGLDRWNNWQLAETLDVYIAEATSLLKRLLVVVDKETLVVRHLAKASRFAKSWTPVLPEHQDEILG
ncbi:hypothetical protein [Bythopirellula polymerisocia]|uniref:Uncharacterized protein n=1 Tax=Bythopirellula polymerisocia TaxID=2528003 RepID=A0A5C6D086_9BACT|nr:hypothetical protein [Bythopirellula polymerisocia]TWU28319.1 hypothetical protein Pla144_16060 [Bythopirellula polymerisocia]